MADVAPAPQPEVPAKRKGRPAKEKKADPPKDSKPTKTAAEKKTAKAPKVPRKKKSEPPAAKTDNSKVSSMIFTAIRSLNEKNGSSVKAIKNYIGENFEVDIEKISPVIRKLLKSATVNGDLIQTKGRGAAGFKIQVVGSESQKTTLSQKASSQKMTSSQKASSQKMSSSQKASSQKMSSSQKASSSQKISSQPMTPGREQPKTKKAVPKK